MSQLNPQVWNNHYINAQAGWDMGAISPPLKAYFDQLTDKSLKILIPGCGNAYEAEYLHNAGFENVYLLDWAEKPLHDFALRIPEFPKSQLINTDFFEHNEQYDLIIEQTFFCAILHNQRQKYAKHTHKLLHEGGKLVGLFWGVPMNPEGTQPPFGGNAEEYRQLFEPYFHIEMMDDCRNSIKPRAGRELFIKLLKK